MSDPLIRKELNESVLFSVVYSTQPSQPVFTLHAASGSSILVYSTTAVASSVTEYSAVYTVRSEMILAWCFTASYTNGSVVNRGLIKGVKTTAI